MRTPLERILYQKDIVTQISINFLVIIMNYFKIKIMLKNILNLNQAKGLTKNEQKSIYGGHHHKAIGCSTRRDCFIAIGEFDWACSNGQCIPL